MSRVIDFIRNNLFWVVIGLVVVAIGLGYTLVSRGMAEEVERLRKQSQRSVSDLKLAAAREEIPNAAAIEAAQAEARRVEMLSSQLMLAFVQHEDPWGRDFDSLRGVTNFDGAAAANWRREYYRRHGALREEMNARINASPETLPLEQQFSSLDAVRQVQRRFWQYKYIIEQLAAANPPDAPTLKRVSEIALRSGAPTQNTHPWLSTTAFEVGLTAEYRAVPKVIATLANAPWPITVTKWSARKTTGTEPQAASDDVTVRLFCEIVTFRPRLAKVKFDGGLFQTADGVRAWLDAQSHELDRVLNAVAAVVPDVGRRVEATLDPAVREQRQKIETALAMELESIEKRWAEQERVRLSAVTVDGKVPDEKAQEIEAEVNAGRAAEEEAAREKAATELASLPSPSGSFEMLYRHLYPGVPQKAYFVGGSEEDRSLVLVRAPEKAPGNPGHWWLARAWGKPYRYRREGTRQVKFTWRQMVDGIRAAPRGGQPRVALAVDEARPEDATLFFHAQTGALVEVLTSTPGGFWQRYRTVRVGGGPLGLHEATFKAAAAIQAARRAMAAPGAFDPESRTVTLTPPDQLAGLSTVTLSVPGNPGGTLEITLGLQK